jgi:DNA-binding NarL/FixJ family response regulator
MPVEAIPTLSSYQRRVLWLLSQGNTVKEVAALLHTHPTSVTDSALSFRRKLHVRTNIQAVLRAYQLGLLGVREDCGTRASYLRHLNADEDACPACRTANVAWLFQQSQPAPVVREPQPLHPAQVKLIRALHGGRTHREIQFTWGVGRSRLHRTITDMYARLGVEHVPREQRREAALIAAREQGYIGAVAPVLPPPVIPALNRSLTPLEQATLAAVNGRTLAEASEELGIPRSSVSSRLHAIYYKLGVSYLPRKDKRQAALEEARNRRYSV